MSLNQPQQQNALPTPCVMTAMPNEKSPQSHRHTTTAPPSRPGVYWSQGGSSCRKVLVKVRRKKAELAVWLFNYDVPVADQNGHWRGPIQPATGLTTYSALTGGSK